MRRLASVGAALLIAILLQADPGSAKNDQGNQDEQGNQDDQGSQKGSRVSEPASLLLLGAGLAGIGIGIGIWRQKSGKI